MPFKGKTRVDIFKAVTIEKEIYDSRLNAHTTVALCKDVRCSYTIYWLAGQ